jgi:uncharacterized protein Smg (DUF494 family)
MSENERVVDAIICIITRLKAKNVKNLNEFLKSKFSEKEVSTAFSWVLEKLESKHPNELLLLQMFPSKSFRVFHEAEKDFFTKDAFASVVKLLSIGLISNEHIEMMIDGAENFGLPKINNDMVKQYVAACMFNVPPPNHIGSRFTLSSYDSIN